MSLPFDWIAGLLVADDPVELGGDRPTIDVIVVADFPGGVVVRYVVNWTVDVDLEDMVRELKLELEPVDVVVEEL